MSARGKREQDTLDRMDRAVPRLQDILARFGAQGLQRATGATASELQAAAQLAHSASLIRVERELTALASHVERYLTRDPLYRSDAALGCVNRCWVLLRQTGDLRRADPGLEALLPTIGQARRRYTPLDDALEVQALAATGWVSDTDFLGVSVHLGAADREELCQISLVRPTMSFGTDPQRLLRQPVSDMLMLTIQDLAHGAWTFEGARMSADGRLSLHRDLELSAAPHRGLAAYANFAVPGWAEIVERIRKREVGPLGGRGGCLAYIQPVGIGELELDDKRARARLGLVDRRGATLWAQIPLAAHNNLWVDNLAELAQHPRARPDGWFGSAWVGGSEALFTPWTAVYHQEVVLEERRRRRRVHEVHLSLEPLAGLIR